MKNNNKSKGKKKLSLEKTQLTRIVNIKSIKGGQNIECYSTSNTGHQQTTINFV